MRTANLTSAAATRVALDAGTGGTRLGCLALRIVVASLLARGVARGASRDAHDENQQEEPEGSWHDGVWTMLPVKAQCGPRPHPRREATPFSRKNCVVTKGWGAGRGLLWAGPVLSFNRGSSP
jgi:hypothetical protein